jgi:hypothetical protein
MRTIILQDSYEPMFVWLHRMKSKGFSKECMSGFIHMKSSENGCLGKILSESIVEIKQPS